MGGFGVQPITVSLQHPGSYALALQQASLPRLQQLLGPLQPTAIQAYVHRHPGTRTHFVHIGPRAEVLRKAIKKGDAAQIRSARFALATALRKLIQSAERQAGITRFEKTSAVVQAARGVLRPTHRPTTPSDRFRATTLHLSPKIGGGTRPIRPGLSRTVPLRQHPTPSVLFISLFPLSSNGSGTYTRAMAEQVAARGGDARVLFLGHQFEGAALPGISEYLVPFTPAAGTALDGAARSNVPVFDSNPASPNGTRFQGLTGAELEAYTEGLADAVAEAARDMQPDILVVNHAWVGAEAARRTGLPYIVVCHGTCSSTVADALQGDNGYPDNAADLVLPGVRGANRVVAIMGDIQTEVHDVYGVDRDHIPVIHNGFHDDIFVPRAGLDRQLVLTQLGVQAPNASHVVSFAGRMVEYRGLRTLFQAIPTILERQPDVHFVLAGDGQDRQAFEDLARELSINDRVHFIGHRKPAELAELYNVSDLGVVPTYRDAFGIGAVEMAGTGIPVITSDVGGLRHIVTNAMGRRVPPANPTALAGAISQALREDLHAQLGHEASRYAHQNFPWSRTGEALLKEIRKVLGFQKEGKRTPAEVIALKAESRP